MISAKGLWQTSRGFNWSNRQENKQPFWFLGEAEAQGFAVLTGSANLEISRLLNPEVTPTPYEQQSFQNTRQRERNIESNGGFIDLSAVWRAIQNNSISKARMRL